MPHSLTTLLLAQRQAGTQLTDLPADLVPQDLATAYAIQNETVAALGPIGAWKVSPMPETGTPFCSPIPAFSVHQSGSDLRRADYADFGIEVEVAVTLARDLPARDGDYTPADLRGAIGSVHVALELLASRYADRSKMPQLANFADLQSNGCVVLGPSVDPTTLPEFGNQELNLYLDDALTETKPGGATTENVLAALAWLANHVVGRGLMLKAGDVIITGARIGPVPFAGKVARAEAPGLGVVSATFN